MSLQNVPLEKIDEADIRRLLSMGVPNLYTWTTSKKHTATRALMVKISRMYPRSQILWVAILSSALPRKKACQPPSPPLWGDGDSEKRRLEQIALSGLEPRIPNLQIRSVPISTGGHVIIIRAPRSFMRRIALLLATAIASGQEPGRQNTSPTSNNCVAYLVTAWDFPSACGFFRPIGSLRLRLETRRYQ